MKQLVLILLMIMVFPITAFASEIVSEDGKPLLSIEGYADDIKQFRTILKKDIGESSDNYYIINALQAELNANWKQSYEPRDQEQADYRVIFIDVSINYKEKSWFDWSIKLPDLDPPLPYNKHAGEVGIAPYNFISPWMRGVLYIKDGKHIGGVIFLPLSQFARINELYHAAHQEWGEFSIRDSKLLDEMSIPNSVYNSTFKQYREMFISDFKNGLRRKSLGEIEKIFTPKGKTELVMARLMYLSVFWDGQIYMKWDTCIKNSNVFYRNLYEHLFNQLFTKTAHTTDDKIIHNIAPSKEILQSLHEAAGNYNCFSTRL